MLLADEQAAKNKGADPASFHRDPTLGRTSLAQVSDSWRNGASGGDEGVTLTLALDA